MNDLTISTTILRGPFFVYKELRSERINSGDKNAVFIIHISKLAVTLRQLMHIELQDQLCDRVLKSSGVLLEAFDTPSEDPRLYDRMLAIPIKLLLQLLDDRMRIELLFHDDEHLREWIKEAILCQSFP